MMPNMPKTVDPKDIVSRANCECLDIDFQNSSDSNNETKVTNELRIPTAPQSQIVLDCDAIYQNRVHLVDTGCWLVKGSDGKIPNAVPKEACSCPVMKTCYHIMACKLMIGLSVEDITSSNNIGLLHQQVSKSASQTKAERETIRL